MLFEEMLRAQAGQAGNAARPQCHTLCKVSAWLRNLQRAERSLGHGRDTMGFTDASSMCNVRLGNIDAACLEVRPKVLSSKETLAELRTTIRRVQGAASKLGTHGNWDRRLSVQLFEFRSLGGQ